MCVVALIVTHNVNIAKPLFTAVFATRASDIVDVSSYSLRTAADEMWMLAENEFPSSSS